MAFGIHFDAILDHVSFVSGTKAMSSAVQRMASQIVSLGGNVEEAFRKMLDRGQTEAFAQRAKTISDTFKSIIGDIGLTGSAAAQATDKIDKAMEAFANSTDKPKKRFQQLVKEVSAIYNELKTSQAPVANANSTSAIPALERRLTLEEDILDVLKKQREEAVRQREIKAQDVVQKQDDLSNVKSSLDRKYRAAAVGFYEESDAAMLESSQEALAKSRMAWEESNAQVQVYDQLISEANANTQTMTASVDNLKNVYKGFADTAESTSTKIFISEDVFNRYHDLSSRIEELKAQISSMPDTDVNVPELERLQGELSQAQEEFRALDETTRHAAEVLGEDFGSRVAKALNNLYDMNDKVRVAQENYNNLQESLHAANEELRKQQEAKDPQAIMKAREEVDKLTVSLDKASDELSQYTAKQKDAIKDVEKLSKNFDEEMGVKVDMSGAVSEAKNLLGTIASIAGIGFGLNELKDFFSKAKEWRSYFQDIESSMKVFLGSAEKGEEFTKKLKDYAYYNMFEFSDLAAASQQMISYGHDVESIIPRLDQLSNVATGTHGSLMDLVHAYNRAKATGVVDARGVQAWAVKGVMIRDVLRDMGEVASGTTITFDQLNKVLDKVTGEGGQFHNLMGEMMDNISAEQGQLQDNLAAMYSEIGEKYEGVFVKFLKLQGAMADNYQDIGGGFIDWGADAANAVLDELMEHWREIISLIKDAVVIYGSYRAALIATTAVQKAKAVWDKAALAAQKLNNLEATKETLAKAAETASEITNTAAKDANAAASGKQAVASGVNTAATNAETVAKGRNTAATVLLTKAWNGLTTSMLANPYVLAAAGIAALVYAIYSAYDSMLTEAEAQRMLNSAAEDFNDTMEEQKQKDLANISVIQDKTASLVAQTKAYKELIAQRAGFKNFTIDEIANMSSEQINAMLNEDTARKNEERIRNQVEAAKELQQIYANAGNAFGTKGENEKIDEIIEKYKLAPEYAEKIKDSIGNMTDLSEYFDQLLKSSEGELQEFLSSEAESGVVEGLQKGFSNPEAKAAATNILNNYSERISESTASIEKEIADAQARLNNINSGEEKIDSKSERIKTINELNEKIESLQQNLSQVRGDIGKTFDNTLSVQLKSAGERVDELRHKLTTVTGTEKAEVEVQLKQAIDERDTWESIKKLIEAGKLDTELVMNVTRNLENEQLGDEKLVEIGEGYQKIDDLGQAVANKMEEVRGKFEEMPTMSYAAAQQMMEDMGLTAEGIEGDFAETREALSSDIDSLEQKLIGLDENTEEARKLKLEILRKKEQLQYLDTLKTSLVNICKNPFNLRLKLSTLIPDNVKQILNKFFGLNLDAKGEEAKDTSVSGRAQQEAADAKIKIDAKKAEDDGKMTGSQWKKHITSAEQDEIKRLRQKLNTKLTQKEYEETQRQLDALERKYKSSSQRANRAATEAANRRAKTIAEELKFQDELSDLLKKAEDARSSANIAAIKDDGERERAERKAQHEKRLRDIEEEEKEIFKKIYQQRKSAYEIENKDKKYENTEAGAAGWKKLMDDNKDLASETANLTEKEAQQVRAVRARMAAERDKENADEMRRLDDLNEKRTQSMRNFLKEYGNAEERRLAIAQEYDEKILKAQTEGERLVLQVQKRQAIQSFDNNQMMEALNFEDVFNNLGELTLDKLRDLRSQLRDLMSNDSLDFDQYKAISEQIQKVNEAIMDEEERERSFLGIRLPAETTIKRLKEEQAEAMKEQVDAARQLANASTEFSNAQVNVQNILDSIGVKSESPLNTANITQILDDVEKKYGRMSPQYDKVQKAMEDLAKSENKLNTANKKKSDADGKVTSVTSRLSEALGDAQKRVREFADSMENILANLNSLPDLLSNLGLDGLSGSAQSVADAANSAMGAASDFASGNYIGAASKVLDTAKSITDAIGLGDNTAKMQKEIEKLNLHSEALTAAMGSLEDAFENAAVGNAGNIADDMKEVQSSLEKNASEAMIREAEKHGTWRASLNSSVQDNAEWKKAMQQVSSILGFTVKSSKDFLSLSADDMKKILDYDNGELLNKIIQEYRKEGGKGGRSENLPDMILNYINQFSGAIDEIDERLYEKLTTSNAGSVFDEYMSALNDFANGSADAFESVAENWEQMVNRMLISNILGGKYQDAIYSWYDEMSKAIAELDKQKDSLTDEEYRRRLKNITDIYGEEYKQLMEQGKTDIENLRAAGIITTESLKEDKSATITSTDKITYDQADLLVGIATAIQIAVEHGNNDRAMIMQNLTMLEEATRSNGSVVAGIRNLLMTTNEYLYDIRESNDAILSEFGVKMDRIVKRLEEF